MEKIKDVKLAMMVTALAALDYLKLKPTADVESVMRHIIEKVHADNDAKIAGIAAANFVIKYVQQNPGLSQKQVMQQLVNSTNEILDSIENETQEMPDLQEIHLEE